jgi:hypothetical protein
VVPLAQSIVSRTSRVRRNQTKGGHSYMLAFRITRISCAGVVMLRSSARRRTYSMDSLCSERDVSQLQTRRLEWSRFGVQHYADQQMEDARRECVGILLDADQCKVSKADLDLLSQINCEQASTDDPAQHRLVALGAELLPCDYNETLLFEQRSIGMPSVFLRRHSGKEPPTRCGTCDRCQALQPPRFLSLW